MKRVLLATTLVLGCGGARTAEPTTSPPPPAADSEVDDIISTDPQVTEAELSGEWRNASCGDRKYLRKIMLSEDGTFEAVDEVAPCPEGSECVSSGIVNWHGEWSLDDNTVVQITAQPKEGGKLPEQTPESFVVLSLSPLSIGEKTGQLVCPYRKEN